MSRADEYNDHLRSLRDWDSYLVAESRLPGPRANIELARAVADIATEAQAQAWLGWTPERAPTSSATEFLPFCGVLTLGRLAVEGNPRALGALRVHAEDPRWRMREGVAMALQRLGRADFDQLLTTAREWVERSRLLQRAALAGLCHPDLLSDHERATTVLDVVDMLTQSLVNADDTETEGFRVLRKALGYSWSVVVASDPEAGKPMMARWVRCSDPQVRRVMAMNLAKKRLIRMDAGWVEAQRRLLRSGSADPPDAIFAAGRSDRPLVHQRADRRCAATTPSIP